MSTNEHLGKIQRLAGDIADRYPDAHHVTQDLIAHATALESALAASEARVAELERENGQLRQLRWIEFMEQTEAEVFAGDGDLPAEEV